MLVSSEQMQKARLAVVSYASTAYLDSVHTTIAEAFTSSQLSVCTSAPGSETVPDQNHDQCLLSV